MAGLKERSTKISNDNLIKADVLERLLGDFDNNFRQLDARRISQVTELDSSAVLADVIEKVNELIGLLNTSDLTED